MKGSAPRQQLHTASGFCGLAHGSPLRTTGVGAVSWALLSVNACVRVCAWVPIEDHGRWHCLLGFAECECMRPRVCMGAQSMACMKCQGCLCPQHLVIQGLRACCAGQSVALSLAQAVTVWHWHRLSLYGVRSLALALSMCSQFIRTGFGGRSLSQASRMWWLQSALLETPSSVHHPFVIFSPCAHHPLHVFFCSPSYAHHPWWCKRWCASYVHHLCPLCTILGVLPVHASPCSYHLLHTIFCAPPLVRTICLAASCEHYPLHTIFCAPSFVQSSTWFALCPHHRLLLTGAGPGLRMQELWQEAH